MRIAVVLESKLEFGGGFQQELSTIHFLNKHQDIGQFIFYSTEKKNIEILKGLGIEAKHLNVRSISHRVYCCFSRFEITRRFFKLIGIVAAPFERIFIQDYIDLVYFLTHSSIASFVTKTNYILTVLDLCHRHYPEFPEVNFDGIFEYREGSFINALSKAVAILTNCESLKADIIRYYGCDSERVHIIKFLPSMGIRHGFLTNVKEKYSLKNRYIFYPAQFWAHKNHVYILDGLKFLRDKYGIEIDAVFSGSDRGNLQFILSYAKKLGLENKVRYVGFVPNEEIFSFYQQAIALVMPTYFGPTNMPPLEAFAIECPVCYPDCPGLRDQVRDAAFLMNLDDPNSMAQHVMTILNDPAAVQTKVKNGKHILSEWTEDDSWDVLKEIFDEYARKRRTWTDS